jgi:hypothetical protein
VTFWLLNWKNGSATLSRPQRPIGFRISTTRGNPCGNLCPSISDLFDGYLAESSEQS